MKIPKVEKGSYVIINAERSTGKILNNDGVYYQSTGEDYYLIIKGKDETEEKINNILNENDHVEILLYDHEAQFVGLYRH